MLTPRAITTILLTALSLSACGGGGSTSSTPSTPATNVAGNYTGTVTDNLAGQGTATIDVTQSGSTLGGTFADVFSSASNSGTLSGTINGTAVTFTLTSSAATGCPYRFTGTLSGTTISGTYATFNCQTTDGGTITVNPA